MNAPYDVQLSETAREFEESLSDEAFLRLERCIESLRDDPTEDRITRYRVIRAPLVFHVFLCDSFELVYRLATDRLIHLLNIRWRKLSDY